jgi:transposase
MEASGFSYTIYDLIEDLVSEIQIANPYKVKAIAEAAVKTDKIDARTLAHILDLGYIPQTHIRSAANREQVQKLRQRLFYVKLRTQVKNRIHDLVSRLPEPMRRNCPLARDLFGKSGRRWLDSLKLPSTQDRLLQSMLKLLDSLNELVKESEGWIQELFRHDPIAQRLATIPGIGKFLAVLIRSEIDDISRFPRVEKLHAYAGLVNTTSSSGGKTHHGKLLKNCNHILKWGLVEAVWPAIQADYHLDQIYRQKTKQKHINVARCIVAKHILSIVYCVWLEDRNYLPQPPLSKNYLNRTALINS